MRLIDADATKRRVADTYFDTLIPCVNRALDDSPTIDAVPVVRCRECKHMIPQSHTRYCTVWNAVNGMGDEGFCNYGERKEGAE